MKTSEAWKGSKQKLCALISAAEEHGSSAHLIGAAVFRESLRLASNEWNQHESYGCLDGLQEITGQGC